MKGLFVTGSDTEVGKTIVTGLLGRYMAERGIDVITQKWIQSGASDGCDDIDVHLELMNKSRLDFEGYLLDMVPYSFELPASPHLAARAEGREIDPERIKESFHRLAEKFDIVLAEGIGGALVPYDENNLVIDIAGELDLSVLIVAGNRLGAINHTLLTIEAIKSRGMEIAGIVFNGGRGGDKVILEDNPRIVEKVSGEKVCGVLGWDDNFEVLYDQFKSIGQAILEQAGIEGL